MAKKNILIVPGDGIGQEVTAVGKKVLDAIASKFGHEFTYDDIRSMCIKFGCNFIKHQLMRRIQKKSVGT